MCEDCNILFSQDIQAGVGRSMRSLMAAGSAIGHRMLGMITRAPSETITITNIITTILLLLIITIMITRAPSEIIPTVIIIITILLLLLIIPIMITQDCSPTPPSCSPRAKCTRSGQRSLPQTAKKYNFKNQYKYKQQNTCSSQ